MQPSCAVPEKIVELYGASAKSMSQLRQRRYEANGHGIFGSFGSQPYVPYTPSIARISSRKISAFSFCLIAVMHRRAARRGREP